MTPRRVLVLGATGTIGRAATRALVGRGHDVVCLIRSRAGPGATLDAHDSTRLLKGATVRFGEATDPASVKRDGFCDEHFDTMLSCLASRTGAPKDAWAVDYRAHADALGIARAAGIAHMILLSAICVQRPLLAFQQAKRAFEQALIASDITYSIVRPTAFFKSLSGQVDRVKGGKPYLVFGDGTLTECKPIGDADLGRYLAECVDDESRWNRILPIGGPGGALTPRQQGEMLFALLGKTPRFQRVPVGLLDAIVGTLATLGRIVPALAQKAELARIGRYYATESMLVLDPVTGRYDADATPSAGSETLERHFRQVLSGKTTVERGDHAVF